MKVLIVDDDNDIQDLIALDMKKAKIDYKQATSVEEAVDLLKNEFFDCMFLDIVLGDTSTSQGVVEFLTSQENQKNINLPVVLMSAYITEGDKERFKKKRFTIFEAVQKPFKKGQLSALALSIPNKNILILDDDEDIVDLLANELKGPGYRVIQSLSCEQAIQNLKHENILCFFVDIVIGEKTSSEVLQHVAKNKVEKHLNFPIVLMSGRMTKAQMDSVDLKNLKIFKRIEKPFKKGEILSYVEEIEESLKSAISESEDTFKQVLESNNVIDGSQNAKGSWDKDNDGTEGVSGATSENDDGTERIKGKLDSNLSDGTERVSGAEETKDDGTTKVKGSLDSEEEISNLGPESVRLHEAKNVISGEKEDIGDDVTLVKGSGADDESAMLVKGTGAEKEDNSMNLIKGTDAEKEDNSMNLIKGTDAEKEDNSSTLVKGTGAEKEDNSMNLVKGTDAEKEDNSMNLIKGTEAEREDKSSTLIKGSEDEKLSEGHMKVQSLDQIEDDEKGTFAFKGGDNVEESSSNYEFKSGIKESFDSSGEKIVEIEMSDKVTKEELNQEVDGKKYEVDPTAAQKLKEKARAQLDFFNQKQINARNEKGLTSLMVAALYGQADVCRSLVDAGSQISLKSKDGKTAMHYAVRSRSIQTVYYLMSAGSRVNDRDEKNIEPLFEAIKHGDSEMVKYLIEKGARLSARIEGESYLFTPARNGDLETFKVLLEGGVDLHTKNKKAQTVISVAKMKKKINILRYIKEVVEKNNEESKRRA